MKRMITLENDKSFLYDCSWIVYDLFAGGEYDDGYDGGYDSGSSGQGCHKYSSKYGDKYEHKYADDGRGRYDDG